MKCVLGLVLCLKSYRSCGGEKIVAAMAASLTVTQLRKELTKRALDTTGLKPALVGFFIEPLYLF